MMNSVGYLSAVEISVRESYIYARLAGFIFMLIGSSENQVSWLPSFLVILHQDEFEFREVNLIKRSWFGFFYSYNEVLSNVTL